MDEKQQQMLEESLRLAQENNAMLRSLIWTERRARIVQVIKWIIIIVITILTFYVLQPMLETVTKLYSGQDINKILDDYNKTQSQ